MVELKPNSFGAWLAQQAEPEGELAAAVLEDIQADDAAGPALAAGTRAAILEHMKASGASRPALEGLHALWSDYKQHRATLKAEAAANSKG